MQQYVQQRLATILPALAGDRDVSRLARGASGTFLLKIASTGLGFAVNVALARVLGPTDYGAYVYVLGWMTLLAVPATLGYDRLVVREVAANVINGSWGMVRGVLQYATRRVIVASAVFIAGTALVSWAVFADNPVMLTAFLIGAILMPFDALTRIRQSALQGYHSVVAAQLPELAVRPLLFLACLGIAALLGRHMHASVALALQVAVTIIAFIVGTILLRRNTPAAVAQAEPTLDGPRWSRLAIPMLFFAALTAANSHADALLVGSLAGPKAAGLFTVAALGSGLIGFPLMAVNIAFAPAAASLHAQGDLERLQKITTLCARVMSAIALPLTLFFIIGGPWFLSFFGPEFRVANLALAILSVGQFVNVATGSVGILLLMTGHERAAATTLGVSVAVKLVLGFLLIPRWGLEGAAVVSSICKIGWNVSLAVFVYRRLGVRPSIFGARYHPPRPS